MSSRKFKGVQAGLRGFNKIQGSSRGAKDMTCQMYRLRHVEQLTTVSVLNQNLQ
jgi:hypothetical protein